MDIIKYRGVDLDVIRTRDLRYEVQTSEDQTTYLCTKITLDVECTLNPGAVALIAGNPPRGAPLDPPVYPQTTNNLIRQWFSAPRGQLIVIENGVTVIQSPTSNQVPCDCRNGPFVRVGSLVHHWGTRTWIIGLVFETYVYEPIRPAPLGLVSNRWTVLQDTDFQSLSTRIYSGVAVFRPDVLSQIAAAPGAVPGSGLPDFYRNVFAGFGVKQNYKRERVHVEAIGDGYTIRYTVVDKEQVFNINGTPACRIEVQESAWASRGSLSRALMQTAVPAAGAAGAGALNPGQGVAGAVNPAQLVQGLFGNVVANMPKYYKRVHVRIWGNRTKSRQDLVVLGMAMASSRFPGFLIDPAMSELVVSQDTSNFVDVQYTKRYGDDTDPVQWALAPLAAINNLLGNPTSAGARVFAGTLTADPAVNAPGFGVVFSQQPGSPPPFPFGNGTRGTDLYLLVTQTLEAMGAAPDNVP